MADLKKLAVEEQPDPQFGNGAIVADDLVRWTDGYYPEINQAIMARKELGSARYGQALQTKDGRNTMSDLVQELLDALIYAHKGFMETTGNERYTYIDIRYNLARTLSIIARLVPVVAIAILCKPVSAHDGPGSLTVHVSSMGQPAANMPYELQSDMGLAAGMTDGQGLIAKDGMATGAWVLTVGCASQPVTVGEVAGQVTANATCNIYLAGVGK